MTIDELKKKATASELCLIETVEQTIQQANLNKVLQTFEVSLLNGYLPSQGPELNEIKREFERAVEKTKLDLGIK